MNYIRQRRDFLSAILFVGAAALAISPLLGEPAHAVTITGSAYASETGGIGTNPVSKSYNMTNLSSVSASIESDVTHAHAQSYASASVGPSGVTKTTGGRGWVDVTSPTNLENPRGDVWNASATGTVIEADYTGSANPPPNTATFQFSLPASIAATADPSPNAPPSLTFPVTGGNVAQGVITNSSDLPTSYYAIDVNVVANAIGPGGTTSLFNGSYEFDPVTGKFTPSDDFASSTVDPIVMPLNGGGYSLTFGGSIMGNSFDAPVGTPFTVNIETSMSMGDPSNPAMVDLSNSTGQDGVIGSGGEVTAEFLLSGPGAADFTVMPVPEPSAICLAAFAAAGLVLGLRRRS